MVDIIRDNIGVWGGSSTAIVLFAMKVVLRMGFLMDGERVGTRRVIFGKESFDMVSGQVFMIDCRPFLNDIDG